MILFFIKLFIKYVVILFEFFYSGFNSLLVVVVIEDDIDVLFIFIMKWNKILNIDGNIFYDGDVFYFWFVCFEIY